MPSYTAWTLRDFKADGSTPPSTANRPRFTIQIYDTTPAAASDAHIKWLCQYIHVATVDHRDLAGREERDRIEVYGMPAEYENEGEEARAQRCMDHQKAEIAARNATGIPDFYINWSRTGQFHRKILIIDKPLSDLEGRGEDAHPQSADGLVPNPGPQGGFYLASWDLRPAYAEWWREATRDDPDEDSDLVDELTVSRCHSTLSSALSKFRGGIRVFYESYVREGRLNQELRQARALADANQYAHAS